MTEVPENLKPHLFSSTNQPAGRGRKPGILAQISRLTGEEFKISITKHQKYQLLESMLERTTEELKELAENESVPVFVKLFAQAIIKDVEVKGYAVAEVIFDRCFGKPRQAVDNNLTGALDFTINFDKPYADNEKDKSDALDGAGS